MQDGLTGVKLEGGLCNDLQSLSPKEQKVGNCYWVTLKTAIRTTICLIKAKGKERDEQAKALAKACLFSKVISATLRGEG